MATATGKNYVQGNLAPVQEELTATDLAVTGTLPDYLDGRYLRNGPNPVTEVDPATHHWFIGTGMLHGVRLRDGRAEWYRNRYVRAGDVADALGEERREGPIHSGMDFAANTHVIGQGGRTFAVVEGGANPYEMTDELDTIGPCDFDGTLPGGYAAHSKHDPLTGELHAMSYFWGWGNKVRYTVIDTEAHVRRIVDVEVTGSPMMHDFSLTADSVVLYDLPVTFNMEMAAAGTRFPYAWDPAYPARVGVMSRESDGSDVSWFDVDPCYVFHPLNAYEDGDRVVLDVVRHPKMFATDHNGPNEGAPLLYRWVVDRSAGKVVEEQLGDHALEFPRIDERLTGHQHRYGYATGFYADPQGDLGLLAKSQSILKHDLVAGTTEARNLGAGTEPGEFVFVPSAPDAGEDDGVLLGYVFDPAADRSDLVVLDAGTLETVASVHLPARVPHGFHGSWIPTT